MQTLSREQNKRPYLTITELNCASDKLGKHVQQIKFSEEITNIQNNRKLNTKSRILPINPYLDSEGILRVGGRIKNANISEQMKHPIILPNNNHLMDVIIDYTHKINFHGGPQLTLAWLRRKFWILGGNNAVKKRLRLCIICRRTKFEKQNQLMGDLAAARTN
jgi:hypothetical protein